MFENAMDKIFARMKENEGNLLPQEDSFEKAVKGIAQLCLADNIKFEVDEFFYHADPDKPADTTMGHCIKFELYDVNEGFVRKVGLLFGDDLLIIHQITNTHYLIAVKHTEFPSLIDGENHLFIFYPFEEVEELRKKFLTMCNTDSTVN